MIAAASSVSASSLIVETSAVSVFKTSPLSETATESKVESYSMGGLPGRASRKGSSLPSCPGAPGMV